MKEKEKRFEADLRNFKESRFAENNPATFGGIIHGRHIVASTMCGAGFPYQPLKAEICSNANINRSGWRNSTNSAILLRRIIQSTSPSLNSEYHP
jgi:hypothetical protein